MLSTLPPDRRLHSAQEHVVFAPAAQRPIHQHIPQECIQSAADKQHQDNSAPAVKCRLEEKRDKKQRISSVEPTDRGSFFLFCLFYGSVSSVSPYLFRRVAIVGLKLERRDCHGASDRHQVLPGVGEMLLSMPPRLTSAPRFPIKKEEKVTRVSGGRRKGRSEQT